MSPREARKKWADLSPPLKTISALAGLAPVVGGVWVFASGFLSLPARMGAVEAQVDTIRVQAQKNTAYIQQDRVLKTFLACTEVARQQHREDPTCLQKYFASQTGDQP